MRQGVGVLKSGVWGFQGGRGGCPIMVGGNFLGGCLYFCILWHRTGQPSDGGNLQFTQVEWGAYFIHNGGGVGARYIGGELTKLGYIGEGGCPPHAPHSHYGEPCISGKWNLRKRNTFESVELQFIYFKTLFAKPTKYSSILKQIDGCCRRISWVCLTTLLG